MGFILTDTVTGEIRELPEGSRVRIITPEDEAKRRLEADLIRMPKSEHFVKLYSASYDMLKNERLVQSEFQIFLFLSDHLRYGSNVAKYDNGVLITRDKLCQDLNISLVTVKRSINTLIMRGIIAEAKITIGRVFIVNPFIAMKGDKIEPTTYDLFKKTKWSNNFGKSRNN